MDLIQGSFREAARCLRRSALTVPFLKPNHATDFQKDACLVAQKAATPSQKISGAVTVACIRRYS